MKKSIFIFIATVGLISCKLHNKSKQNEVNIETLRSEKKVQNDIDLYSKNEYTDFNGNQIIIENGYPRGGIKYTDTKGNVYSYVVFWTRINNKTDNPLELNFDLPINLYKISNLPGKYFKVLVPAYNILPGKIPLINHTTLKSFLDTNIDKPSSFKRMINPNETSGFYSIMLILTLEGTGMVRTELSLKGQNLFYKILRYSKTTLIDEKEIHCGTINLKKN